MDGREAVKHKDESERLMTPSEVAAAFRVDAKTVTRWAKAGKLNAVYTLGGHRRYSTPEVRLLLKRTGNLRPAETLVSEADPLCIARDAGMRCGKNTPHPGERHECDFGSGTYTWGYEPTAAEADASRRLNGGA